MAAAQRGSALEELVQPTARIAPLRNFDPATRPSRRYAVVIGNSDYASIPDLPNAHADARAMAAFLRTQEYQVAYHEDIDKLGFENVLRRVLFDVDEDTEVVVFYAGHGFQIGSENYLVPVDADFDSPYDVPFESVSLGSLVGIVGARARLQIVMLDSCRDNPFAGRVAMTERGSDLRETRTGFTSQAAPLNSMLVFSTAPGSVAFDGEGENSPFTAAFVTEVSEDADAGVSEVFEGVRRRVYAQTQGRQIPWDSSTLVEQASFGIGAALERPIQVASSGTGQARGLAMIAVTGEEIRDSLPTQVAAHAAARIAAEFRPQVAIGPALAEALDLSPEARIAVTAPPETGRLTLRDDRGVDRDMVGRSLSAADLPDLMLSNRSLQRPATSFEEPLIADRFEIEVDGQPRTVLLDLAIDPCDFEAGDHLDPDGMGITRYPNELRPEIALAACDAAIAAQPEVGRFHYQRGRALTALLRFDEARDAFAAARERGHTRAWYALGASLFDEERRSGGYGYRKASDAVLQLYARGAQEGDPYAFHALGRQLMEFGETDAIQIEGYDLIMRAMEVGHTFAMNAMAAIYLREGTEEYDPDRALRYYRESARRGDVYGYYGMGYAHSIGLGALAPDPGEAYRWMRRAAEGGHPFAPYSVGVALADGSATGTPDPAAALGYYLQGLERGHALSAVVAVDLLRGTGVEGYTPFDAAAIAAKGAALGNARYAPDARARLDGFGAREIDGGAQLLLRDLIELTGIEGEIAVDGAFGPDSRTTLARVVDRLDPGATVPTDPAERAVYLASLFWKEQPFRVDLY
ncbi:caspase family protein [Jannaschia seohaensis]|nr:caspase family protein [Jannaschia seohaensis]